MNSQKLENELNMALETTENERKKSADLNVGYDAENQTWELIVKYNGNLVQLEEEFQGLQVVPLEMGYAIVTIRQQDIERFADNMRIEYVEKSKGLMWEVADSKVNSCITKVQVGSLALYGEGTLVAIIDSGIDYAHPDFRNEDGTTRIANFWDQAATVGEPPEGFRTGALYTREKINEALSYPTRPEQLQIVPSVDFTGHGTAVAGIAAGNGRASKGLNCGVATKSELLIVKLGSAGTDSFPRTTQLMQGLTFVLREAVRLGRPVAINVSYGTNYGSHDGNTLLEKYIDDISNMWKNNIVVAVGNEGASRRHFVGDLISPSELASEFAIAQNERTINLQIWKSYVDQFDISLQSPDGKRIGPIPSELGTQRFVMNNTRVLIYYGAPSPFNKDQEIYVELIPIEQYIDEGVWSVILTPIHIIDGEVNMWLPVGDTIQSDTKFLNANSFITLTIPSTAFGSIAVGAYDAAKDATADFSGQGYIRGTNITKPDLVAPGVNITAPAVGGGYSSNTGTSVAAPFVTGSVALLMEYGIVRGNDPYLYGEKVKAYLREGAIRLEGLLPYPNRASGYGRLCLSNSIPTRT